MSQQSSHFLSQGGTSSASGYASQTGSGSSNGGSGTSGSSSSGASGTGNFDPNSLYQHQSQQTQQYLSSHQTGSSASASSGGGSAPTSGSSSGSSGSFDPNAIYKQQSQQNLQNLDSTLKDTNSKFDANNLNKFQTSFTDPTSAQLGASNGGSSGFDPDQYNTMKFNLLSPEQGGQSSSGGQSAGSQLPGATTSP